jgi:hypothetical protein
MAKAAPGLHTSVTSGPKMQPVPPRASFSRSPSCITGSDHSTSHATSDAPRPGGRPSSEQASRCVRPFA